MCVYIMKHVCEHLVFGVGCGVIVCVRKREKVECVCGRRPPITPIHPLLIHPKQNIHSHVLGAVKPMPAAILPIALTIPTPPLPTPAPNPPGPAVAPRERAWAVHALAATAGARGGAPVVVAVCVGGDLLGVDMTKGGVVYGCSSAYRHTLPGSLAKSFLVFSRPRTYRLRCGAAAAATLPPTI